MTTFFEWHGHEKNWFSIDDIVHINEYAINLGGKPGWHIKVYRRGVNDPWEGNSHESFAIRLQIFIEKNNIEKLLKKRQYEEHADYILECEKEREVKREAKRLIRNEKAKEKRAAKVKS